MCRHITHKLALGAAIVMVLVLAISSTALAQDNRFGVGFYANAKASGAPDAQLRFVNDGNTGGTLWADIYVFNNDEQMEECCSCAVSPNGYLDLDVNNDLLGNPLSPEKSTSNGVIEVISSSIYGPTAPSPRVGIRGWESRIEKGGTSGSYSITGGDLKDSTLSEGEEVGLAETCSFVLSLGSGAGACSCAPGKE